MAKKNKLCFSTDIAKPWPIELRQNGVDRFTVVYGKQVDAELNYSDAARHLGAAIMHALTCEGRLDTQYPVKYTYKRVRIEDEPK